MVAQSMSGDANKGDNEVEDLDRGDDGPHGASLPSGVQGARRTSRSSSSREKNRCRGLLAGTSEQEQWASQQPECKILSECACGDLTYNLGLSVRLRQAKDPIVACFDVLRACFGCSEPC